MEAVDNFWRNLKQATSCFLRVLDTNAVTTTQDAVLDSHLLLKTLEITKQRAQKLKLGGSGFDIEEYVCNLRSILNGHTELENLNKLVKKCCRMPPRIAFM
jgi:two-component SAPR family response regulator